METIKLFQWFAQTLLQDKTVFGLCPTQVLEKTGISCEQYSWVSSVSDGEYPLLTVGSERFPDLENRKQSQKRNTGQYYTPEEFVGFFYEYQNTPLNKKVLDPACGTGAFLVQYALKCRTESGFTLDKFHGVDIDGQALLVTLGRLLRAGNFIGLPKLRQKDFLFLNDREKFDLVVGNPPYKVNLDEEYKNCLKKRFKTFEGEKDLYTFFIEAGIKRLKTSGNLILLTSHTYLVNLQCSKIRHLIFEKNHAKSLYLLPERFFPKAPGVLPVVLHLGLAESFDNLKTKIFTSFRKNIGWKNIAETPTASLALQKGFRNALIPDGLKALFKCMDNSGKRLGDVCRIGVGIQESSNRGKVISKFVSDKPIGKNSKPVLKGREIGPFCIKWEEKYLDYGKHLTYAGKPEVFDNPKVLYQNIRNEKLPVRLVAALDKNSFYPKNSLSTISGINKPYSLEFIVGFLNSSVVNAWFSGHFFSFHVTVTQVREIPLPNCELAHIKAVEEIVKIIEKTPEDFMCMRDSLDRAVLAAFGIKNDITELIEQCHNFLEQVAKV